MSYCVREMRREDIRQVGEIDREAFPTMLPPTNLHHELENRMAHYLVIVDTARMAHSPGIITATETGFARIASQVMRLFNHERPPVKTEPQLPDGYISGFVGMWIMVDEAHITSIAVREGYRGRGLGETLLIAIVELAMRLKTRMMTLEVRVSNATAQSLYRKYGFTNVGIRRAYYTDNFEDGQLMSTPNLLSPEFQERFQRLREEHFKKVGIPYCPVTG